jgi:GNAT superfamily N-acetyltransferase
VGTFALFPLDACRGELRKIYLERGLRGIGIGRRVIALLEEHARERGMQKMRAETHSRFAGYAFFKTLGYRSRPSEAPEFLADGTLMEREL